MLRYIDTRYYLNHTWNDEYFRHTYASSEYLHHKRRQVFTNQTNEARPILKTKQNYTHI